MWTRGEVIQPGEHFALSYFNKIKPVNDPVVFDVGANVGEYTDAVLAAVPEARVTCFEPVPYSYGQLRLHAKENWPDSVTMVPYALSDLSGPTLFRATEVNHCYLAGFYREYDQPSGMTVDREIEVTAVLLDDYCADIGVEHIHWLKLDVEGHEYFAIEGAGSMLDQHLVDVIQFEMADVAALAGWTYGEMRDLLDSFGYTCVYEQKSNKLLEAVRFTDRFDNLENYVNMLAVSDSCSWWPKGTI